MFTVFISYVYHSEFKSTYERERQRERWGKKSGTRGIND